MCFPSPDDVRLRRLLLGGIALLSVAGCATYRELPLDNRSARAALQAPDRTAVIAAAANIRHPLVRPIILESADTFSPDEIAVVAVITSPQLRALRDQRGVAQAQILQAGILPNPQLGYTLDQFISGPGFTNGRALGVGWDFTSLIGRQSRMAAARTSGRALDLSIAWQEWQVSEDARLRAFRILGLQRRLPLVEQIERDLSATFELTKKAVGLGERTRTDLATIGDLWSRARASRYALRKQLNAEMHTLKLELGYPPQAGLQLRSEAGASGFLADRAPTAASLLEGLESRRLDLAALRLGYESQEDVLRAAIDAQFPKIGLNVHRANDPSDVVTHGFSLTIDVPIFDRNQGAIARAKATRQQLFDEYLQRVAEAREQVVQLLADLAAAREELKLATDQLPAMADLSASLQKAHANGLADITAYRDARTALASRQLEQQQLQQDLLDLEVALEIATGRPLLDRTSFESSGS